MAPAATSDQEQALVVPLWIDGKERHTSSAFDVFSPAKNETCWKAAAASKEYAIAAVEAAQAAFSSWSKTPPSTRRDVLMRVADIFEANTEEYSNIMSTEMGADAGFGLHLLLPQSVQMLRDIASRVSSICNSVPITEDTGRSCIMYKEPYGVIFGIAPWNAPYVFAVRSIATAIATGNTTVLKGSELSPRCYWAVGKAFHEAGVPPGVVNIIYTRPSDAPEIVNAIIEHPAVRKINFTGSTNTGRQIAKVCGQNLKPCLMELGGKNSVIILPDADIDKAVSQCMLGAFANAGQVCMATDRLIIHKAIASDFLAALKTALGSSNGASQYTQNLISPSSKTRLQSVLSSAIKQGAEVFYGDEKSPEIEAANGDTETDTSFPATVLGNVSEDMDMWRDELFGPLVAYAVVESEEEAVRRVNDSHFGLSASIFTRDLRKALQLARQIESGAVHINSMTIHDAPMIPHGGVKNSGWGRFNAASGMEEFLVQKAVTWDN